MLVILRTYNLHVENINCNEIYISSQNYLFNLHNICLIILYLTFDHVYIYDKRQYYCGNNTFLEPELPWGRGARYSSNLGPLLAFEVRFPKTNLFLHPIHFIIYQIDIEFQICSSEQITCTHSVQRVNDQYTWNCIGPCCYLQVH